MKRTMKEEKSYLIISILIMMLLITGIQNAYPKKIKPKAELVTGALSFNERVACQKAVEKVYYSHRTWNNFTRAYKFEQVMPNDVRIEKVKNIMRKSNALESFWKRPITAYQLQVEIDRMAGHTKDKIIGKCFFIA